jgi:hypothetical protein
MMKTIKILLVILAFLAVALLALHFAFSPRTEPVTFEYRDMPYNFVALKMSDSGGNNPVMCYCLLEEADNENLTFAILQDFTETGHGVVMDMKLKVNLKQGMLESFDMDNILAGGEDITAKMQFKVDFNTNRLSQTYYIHNDRDGKEEPRINYRAIRVKPTWLYSTSYLTDMVVLLPYINTGTSAFTAGLSNGNNYSKFVFKRAADSSSSGTITYQFSPYGIFGLFSGMHGIFRLNNKGSYTELERLSCTQKTRVWKDLLITVLCYQTITKENFDSLRETLSKGEKVNL